MCILVWNFFPEALLKTATFLSYLAKEASLQLQTLKPEDRKKIIDRLADLLQERKAEILAANRIDMLKARQEGIGAGCKQT